MCSHMIINNDLFSPHIDTPNTRDLQLLVTDGEMVRRGSPAFARQERTENMRSLSAKVRSK